MEEIVFNEEGMSFKYLSNWREQKNEINGPNCIKALVKVFDGNPATITVYKNPEDSVNSVEDLKEPMESSFESQGWNIINLEVSALNDIPVMNIVANAEQSGKILELHTVSTLKDNFLYVFELMTFKGSNFAVNDYLAILDSLSFEN